MLWILLSRRPVATPFRLAAYEAEPLTSDLLADGKFLVPATCRVKSRLAHPSS